MLFLNPIYFSLFIFIVVFILLYFFRKKYEHFIIPSNYLWEEAMNEQTSSFRLSKLQKNLLFFLQLFILLFLIILLIQPALNSNKIIASEVVFVIDLSASMDREEHFLQIKNEALEVLDNIQSAKITVVEANVTPTIAFYHETDKRMIKDYLENLSLHYGLDDKQSTFSFVNTLLENKNAPIFIFSDDVTKEEIRKNFATNQVYVFNSALENTTSITNFLIGNDHNGFVTLKNHLEENINGKLLIYEKNSLAQELQVSLTPKETKGFELENISNADYYKVALLSEDSYLVDNEMFFVPTPDKKGVFIEKTIHPYVQKAVHSIDPTSQLIEDVTLASGELLITNQFLPNATSPFIYIHQGKNKVALTPSNLTTKEDELLNYVDFKDVLIVGAYEDLDSSKLDTIVENNQIPLIAKGKTDNQVPFIVINFDMADSDWPLHISFPVFFYSAITYLQEEPLFTNVQPKEELVVTTTNKITIFDENEKALMTFNPLKESVLSPEKPGIYQLKNGNEVQFFSVNINDLEKNLSTGDNFVWNEGVHSTSEIDTTNNEYIRWLIIFVFLLLIIEWGVHIRDNRI